MKRIAFAALLATGCTLIDQNTFNPHARDAPVIPPAPKPPVAAAAIPGPPPLMVIGTTDQAAYADALRKAVALARARKPGVMFDVVEMQPPDVPSTATIGANAAAVARLIVAQGVPQTQVRLAVRPDAAAPPQQVRVYVR